MTLIKIIKLRKRRKTGRKLKTKCWEGGEYTEKKILMFRKVGENGPRMIEK